MILRIFHLVTKHFFGQLFLGSLQQVDLKDNNISGCPTAHFQTLHCLKIETLESCARLYFKLVQKTCLKVNLSRLFTSQQCDWTDFNCSKATIIKNTKL